MLTKYRVAVFLSAMAITILLAGCSATQVALSKKDLDVQTRTSTAIFVDPVSPDKRTIYLDVKSGVMEFDRNQFKQAVKQMVSQNGYTIISDPEAAQFLMIVYVLNLEKSSPTAAEAALNRGYMGAGSIAAGSAAGAAIGYGAGNAWVGAGAGALVGGAAELISSSLVHDVYYMLVCDVQIKEKARKGVYVRKDSKVDTKISDAGTSRQTWSEVSTKKEYRTRIVTTANQVNLELHEAQPLMFKKTAYAMAGFF